MLQRLAIFVFIAFLSASAWAGFDEGLAAYNKADYATALKEWQPLAELGLSSAQYNLGLMYAQGYGVPQNAEEAAKWFHEAAEQGHTAAQIYLGLMYVEGVGVQKNDSEAVKWWRKSVEQGNDAAIVPLGWYTANGWGTEKNMVEGERLLKLAASKGKEAAKEKLQLLQETKACLKKASTLIFGEALNCTSKEALRRALKNGGLRATREDDGYWFDKYDSSTALEGSSELSVAYIHGKFAKAYYEFSSSMNTGKVVEVRNMVVRKYGPPVSSFGTPSVGEVRYTWNLKDGIKVEVLRGWPNTTVHLE